MKIGGKNDQWKEDNIIISFWYILLLGLLPAGGNLIGGIAAEILPFSPRTLSFTLHSAAGVVLAMVAVELMPKALEAGPTWLMVLAFVIGGGLFMLIDMATDAIVPATSETEVASGGAWTIYIGMAIDIFSDGVMIGTGITIHPELGLILSLGQVVADVPTGFATTAAFRRRGVSRFNRILLVASFLIPVLLGTFLGYYGVGGRGGVFKLALLALTAGMLVTMTVEEIVPQAHEKKDARLSTVFFILGFAVFVLLAGYLGG